MKTISLKFSSVRHSNGGCCSLRSYVAFIRCGAGQDRTAQSSSAVKPRPGKQRKYCACNSRAPVIVRAIERTDPGAPGRSQAANRGLYNADSA